MQSSRADRYAGWLLTLTLATLAPVEAGAHRRDEYLQAARIAIGRDRVELELDLTPGIALAGAILGDIDRSQDGVLSAAEQQSYATLVLEALSVTVDGASVRLLPGAATFPDVDAVHRGEGTIRLQSSVVLARQSPGLHRLTFRNSHHRDRSVYLANALVPETPDVVVTAQRRDAEQTELAIDYVVRGAPANGARAWLLAAVAVAGGLSVLLIRRLRALR